MPDGSQRKVKGSNTNGIWITGVAHGRYADVIPVGTFIGSSTSYYTDMYWVNGGASRVVCRSSSYAFASGGVAFANAYDDASYANANIGSRLTINLIGVQRKNVFFKQCRGEQTTAKALFKWKAEKTSESGRMGLVGGNTRRSCVRGK